jgi:glycosyltransferase involved in cell wall biosynthesis
MKTAVIVFPDEWLPYSPTVLNLLQCLKERGYSAKVVTVRSSLFRNFEAYENDVTSFRVPHLLQRILTKLRLYKLLKLLLFLLVHGRTIRKADLCFGVDSLGFVIARLAGQKPYYVSLEVLRDPWLRLALRFGIRHVLIQTKERYDWLFDGVAEPRPYSILPNAPIVESRVLPAQAENELVYFGYIAAEHGAEACIGALQHLADYRLTLKGPAHDEYVDTLKAKYTSLIDAGRLTIDTSYAAPEEVIPFLRRFAAGFCLYDFDLISRADFNYVSCPSGKLFHYLAAGVPIIGSDILGLQLVREKQCGVLLNELTPQQIADAVRVIERDRQGFAKRCLETSAELDFREHFNRFMAMVQR